jgi:fused signal recognition particle receptor
VSLFDKFKSQKSKTAKGGAEPESILETKGNPVIEQAETEKPETPETEKAWPETDGVETEIVKKEEAALSFVERMKKSLSKTRENFTGRIETLIKNNRSLDDDFWDDIEDILIQADCGMKVTMNLVEQMKQAAKKNKIRESSQVLDIMREEIANIIGREPAAVNWAASGPTIIMVVGVNGVGKTTSIAKLAYRYKKEGRKVLLAAADTFRAAAIDQLQIWADRVGVEMIKHQEKADPGAVVFDALSAAGARKVDVLIIDTAGRLQNKVNLMNEIGKIRKIIERERPDAPNEVLLVLDATTGQNALSQAQVFSEVSGITGIVLTKLDGTAKGGIVLALARELNIPLKYVGMGEGLEDLRDFSPAVFAKALMYRDKTEREN